MKKASQNKDEYVEKPQKTHVFTRLAKLSHLKRGLGKFLSYFIMAISCTQLIFLSLRVVCFKITNDDSSTSSVMNQLTDFFNFDDIFSYDEQDRSFIFIFIAICLYLLIILFSFLMAVMTARSAPKVKPSLVELWPVLLKVHPMILFFPIHSLCISIQTEYCHGRLHIFSLKTFNEAIFCCSILASIINALFALSPYLMLSDVLPTRDPLSSKDSYIDQVILYQKLLIPVLLQFLSEKSYSIWIAITMHLCMEAVKMYWYLRNLPRYSFKTFIVEFHLISLTAVTSLTVLVVLFLGLSDSLHVTRESIAVYLAIIYCLTIPSAYAYSKTVLREIMFTPYERLNASKAVQKLFSLKYLKKNMTRFNHYEDRIEVNYFYFSVFKNYRAYTFTPSNKDKLDLDFEDKTMQDQMKRGYLEQILVHFGDSTLIKLILAQFYSKNLQLYSPAIRVLSKIKSQSPKVRLSLNLIRVEIQERVLAESKTSHEGLSLYDYFETTNEEEALKLSVKKQLKLQMNFWKEVSQDKPDMSKLHSMSGDIQAFKGKINREMSYIETKPLSNYYMFLLFGYYQIILNNAPLKARTYFSKYNTQSQRSKINMDFQDIKGLNNLIITDGFSVTLQTGPNSTGLISNCSKSIRRALGYDRSEIIGLNVGRIMTDYIASKHNAMINNYLKTGHSTFFGNIQHIFVKSKWGFLKRAVLYAGVHPFVQQEIYLSGLITILPKASEYILITPNGKIDSCTREIGQRLGIAGKSVHITSICREFSKINDAFNQMAGHVVKRTAAKSLVEDNKDQDDIPISKSVSQHNMDLTFSVDEQIHARRLLGGLHLEKSLLASGDQSGRNSLFNPQHQQLSKEEAKGIFEKYSTESQKLHFKSVTDSTNTIFRAVHDKYSFACKVSLLTYKNDFMKVLEIALYDKDEFDKREDEQASFKSRSKTGQTLAIDEDEEDEGDEEFDLEDIDEKEHGWIGGQYMKNKERISISKKMKKDSQIELIPMNHKPSNVTSKSVLSSTLRKFLVTKRTPEESVRKEPVIDLNQSPGLNRGIIIAQSSIGGSSHSKNNTKIPTYIQAALDVHYYPKPVHAFLFFVPILFIAVLICQLSLCVVSTNAINTLKSLTTTLDLANQRVDAIIYMTRGVRGAYLIQQGYVTKSDTGAYKSITGLINSIPTLLPVLKSTNQQLQYAITDIDQRFQASFTSTNIRIYDVETDLTVGSYRYFNTFSATTILIERLLRITDYYNATGTYNVQDLSYYLVNAINDLLIETINSKDILLAEILFSKKQNFFIIDICYILSLCFLGIFTVVALYFMSWVYSSEIDLALRYVKMPAKHVSFIQNKLMRFNRAFEAEDYDQLAEIGEENVVDEDKVKVGIHGAVKWQKSLLTAEARKGYWRKAVMLLLTMGCFFAIAGLTYHEIPVKIERMNLQTRRLVQTQTVMYEASIAITALITYFVNNKNTATIRNRPVEEEAVADIEGFASYINIMFTLFEVDGGISGSKGDVMDPEFAAFFTNDACTIVPASVLATCKSFAKSSDSLNVLSLLSFLHSFQW